MRLFHHAVWFLVAFPALAADDDLTMDGLRALLPPAGPQTIEALVEKLPEDYRRYYTLVYGQESSQPGSFSEPRVISFGSKATFILAFNGHPGAEGGDRVETIRVNPDTGAYEFQELIFDREGKKAPVPGSVNPERCTSCHGRPPKPRWANYRYWPGVYGSMDSRVPVSAEDKNAVWGMNGLDGRRNVRGAAGDERLSHDERAPFQATMKEPEKYAEYLAAREKHPRYKHLLLPAKAEGGNGSYLSGFDKLKQFDREPNAMLGFFLHRHLARNLANRAIGSAYAAKYETVFLASLLDCMFVPVKLDEYGRATPTDPEKQTALMKKLNDEMTRDLVLIGAKERERFLRRDDLHAHQEPLSLLMGVPMGRGVWSMNPGGSSYMSSDGSGFDLGNLVANFFLKRLVAKENLDAKLHSQGTLAEVYKDDGKGDEGAYGYIKDRALVANLDAIAVGVVNERAGLTAVRRAKAKVCDAIRPAVVAAVENLDKVKVDPDRVKRDAAHAPPANDD